MISRGGCPCGLFRLLAGLYDCTDVQNFLTSLLRNGSALRCSISAFCWTAAVDPLLTLGSLCSLACKLRPPWEESAVHLFGLERVLKMRMTLRGDGGLHKCAVSPRTQTLLSLCSLTSWTHRTHWLIYTFHETLKCCTVPLFYSVHLFYYNNLLLSLLCTLLGELCNCWEKSLNHHW